MTLAVFHDFPGLANGLPKFHDFPHQTSKLLISFVEAHKIIL